MPVPGLDPGIVAGAPPPAACGREGADVDGRDEPAVTQEKWPMTRHCPGSSLPSVPVFAQRSQKRRGCTREARTKLTMTAQGGIEMTRRIGFKTAKTVPSAS